MRYRQFFRFTLLLVSVLLSLNSLAQESSHLQLNLLSLPDGAKARLGKGRYISGTIAYSPDGRLAVGNNIGVWFYNAATPTQEVALFSGQLFRYIAFSPDGNTLAGGSANGTISLLDADTGEHLRTFIGHTRDVSSISFSPDGSILASSGADNTVRLWDTDTGEHLRTFEGGKFYHREKVAFSPDGSTLVFWGEDGLWLWDMDMEEHVLTLEGRPPVAFSPDGHILASTSGENLNNIILWDAHSGRYLRLHTLELHTLSPESIAFSPDGRILASAGEVEVWRQKVDGIILWDTDTGKRLRTLTQQMDKAFKVVFSPDGTTLASASRGGTYDEDNAVRLWDVSDAVAGEYLQTLPVTTPWHPLALSPDGSAIVITDISKDDDGGIIYGHSSLWDIDTGELRHTFEMDKDSFRIPQVVFSHDGGTLATASYLWGAEGSSIRLWDVDTGELGHTFEEPYEVYSVALSSDKLSILTVGSYGNSRLLDVETGQLLREFKGTQSEAVAFSPDGRMITRQLWHKDWQGNYSYTIELLNANTKKTLHVFPMGASRHNKVTFSPDSSTIAIDPKGRGHISLWDANTGELVRTLVTGVGGSDVHGNAVFSPDGRIIAGGGADGTIRLWDADTGELVHTLTGYSVTLGLDGAIATFGNGTVLLWESTLLPDTRNLVRTFEGHTARVHSVAFSPLDGNTIASGDKSGNIHLWDADTGELLRALDKGEYSIAFSPDGNTIASGGSWHNFNTPSFRLWNADTGELLLSAGHRMGATLSVAFSPDGNTVASGSLGHLTATSAIRLWNADTGEHLRTIEEASVPNNLAFSPPDGRIIASGEHGGIRLWSAETGELLRALDGAGDSFAFSPDGGTIASSGGLWDTDTGKLLHTIDGGVGDSFAFSPDGGTVAGGVGTSIRLWNANTGELLHTIDGPWFWVTSVAFSPDGSTIVSGGSDGTVSVWTSTPSKPDDGVVVEPILGDVNNDGIVNAGDLVLVAMNFGATGVGITGDVNADGIVGVADLVFVAKHFGEGAAAAPLNRQSIIDYRRLPVITVKVDYTRIQQAISELESYPDQSPTIRMATDYLQAYLAATLETELLANYPNPFNPETWIPYHLAHDADVVLTIYDMKGAKVRELNIGHQLAGVYADQMKAAYWDGRN